MSLNISKTAVTLAATLSAVFLATSLFAQNVENDDFPCTEWQNTETATMDVPDTCRFVNLHGNPDDLSPALDWITVRTKQALAASQTVILLFGENHSMVSHVRLAELARGALETVGITDIAIAREQVHNLSEYFLTHYFSEYFSDMKGQEKEAFQTQAIEALRALKKEDPAHYHKINALFHAAGDWPQASLTKHENVTAWRAQGVSMRLIDITSTNDDYIDSSEPETKAFLVQTPLVLENIIEIGTISITRPKGMHLRNLFMAAQMQEILKEKEEPAVLLVQTGLDHLGGREKNGELYENSLHALLHSAENKEQNIKILSIFPETARATYNKLLSTTAHAAMNNPDTLVLRGLNSVRHRQGEAGSFPEEAQALHSLYNASGKIGTAPRLNGKEDYSASLEEMKEQVRQEVRQLVAERQNPPQKTPQAQPLAFF